MILNPRVKICGITEESSLSTCAVHGADMLGFVFYPPSPRYIDTSAAAILAKQARTEGVRSVALFVDPSDEALAQVLPAVHPDVIQLHGDESPDRVAEIKGRYGLPVIKAFRVAEVSDLLQVQDYNDVADWFIFDAKPENASLPGGTGEVFDWSLLKGRGFKMPWLLSGGLHAGNILSACDSLKDEINFSGFDVSSGVEKTRGVKSDKEIQLFLETCRSVF